MIDCDKLVHSVYSGNTEFCENIAKAFGDHLIVNGVVDRKALGTLVFQNEV